MSPLRYPGPPRQAGLCATAVCPHSAQCPHPHTDSQTSPHGAVQRATPPPFSNNTRSTKANHFTRACKALGQGQARDTPGVEGHTSPPCLLGLWSQNLLSSHTSSPSPPPAHAPTPRITPHVPAPSHGCTQTPAPPPTTDTRRVPVRGAAALDPAPHPLPLANTPRSHTPPRNPPLPGRLCQIPQCPLHAPSPDRRDPLGGGGWRRGLGLHPSPVPTQLCLRRLRCTSTPSKRSGSRPCRAPPRRFSVRRSPFHYILFLGPGGLASCCRGPSVSLVLSLRPGVCLAHHPGVPERVPFMFRPFLEIPSRHRPCSPG